MIKAKRTGEGECGNPRKRAAEAERAWLAGRSAEERRALQIHDTGREDARLRDALTVDDEAAELADARKAADGRRQRAKETERDRERSRSRPHKHLPAGVVELPFVEEQQGDRSVVRPASKGAQGARVALGFRAYPHGDSFERVTPELAGAAVALRASFDVQPYDGARFTSATGQVARPMKVRREVANAIRAAAACLDEAWISILIELATDALAARVRVARGAVHMVHGLPRPSTNPAGVHHALRAQVRRLGRDLPSHVDVALVTSVLEGLAVGGGKGGRSGKVSVDTMRARLAVPSRLPVKPRRRP